MSDAALLERTRAYIAENFLYTRPDLELAGDDSLLDSGIVDSMGVMELVEFLQAEFAVVVNDDEITEENLGTLNGIVRFVGAKLAASVALPAAS